MPTGREYRALEKRLSKYTLREVLDDLSPVGNTIDYDMYFGQINQCENLLKVIVQYLNISSDEFQDYYLSRSGNKLLSKIALITALKAGSYDPITNKIDVTQWMIWLIDYVEERYGASLLATAKAYFDSEYNPIDNYSMTETETPNITETTSGSSNSKVESESHASSSIYGFNSTDAVPATKSDADTTTEALKANNFTDGSRTTTGTRTLTRSGNIGVTTSQQMLESELELRKFDLLERVFKCFDKVFVRSVYAR